MALFLNLHPVHLLDIRVTIRRRNTPFLSITDVCCPTEIKTSGIKYLIEKVKVVDTSTNKRKSYEMTIRVITKLPNSEQSYKGKVKTHNYINRQNQSTTGKLWKRNDPDLVQAFLKKWWVESDFKAPNLPLSLRFKGSGCHYNSI